MRQLWPLNRASLETGPFFPFDNGPNGVNTLVAPQWLTRWVPLLDVNCVLTVLWRPGLPYVASPRSRCIA